MPLMDGILLIDKPVGWTSFDVVAKVRGALRASQKSKVKSEKYPEEKLSTLDIKLSTPLPKVKVGHTGTLDPLATGLLIIVVGSYCKRAQEFSGMDKVYEVTMKLGQTSTTGDEEGEKVVVSSKQPVAREVQAALEKFTGNIMQTPPIYSAIKVNGQRAYKLAREGKEVKLEPRPVKIYSIEMTEYEYPIVKFITKVSSGTYIRSLVEDIGSELGVGAYMSNLRRTEVGSFKIEDAQEISTLELNKIRG
jgi:tRNA pseudouridine55 synthase